MSKPQQRSNEKLLKSNENCKICSGQLNTRWIEVIIGTKKNKVNFGFISLISKNFTKVKISSFSESPNSTPFIFSINAKQVLNKTFYSSNVKFYNVT